MLNLTAFRILSDTKRIPNDAARLFLKLVCDFDLAHFRAISMHKLMKMYKGNSQIEMAKLMNPILKSGLLEIGPTFPEEQDGRLVEAVTYRIPSAYLLTGKDLAYWDRDIRALRERETLLPVEPRPR